MDNITANERLIYTLLFSMSLYLAVLFGVGFEVTSPLTNQAVTNIEVTLVKQKTDTPPEEADYLAQVTNEGGGLSDQKDPSPSDQMPTDSTFNQKASGIPKTEVVNEADDQMAEVTAKTQVDTVPEVPQLKPEPETAKAPQVITQQSAERKITEPTEITEKVVEEQVITPPQPKVSARQLMMNAYTEIARLEQEFDAHAAALSKRPKKKRISASTKEDAAAAYMASWTKKVEKIGNNNYPLQAKRMGLSGKLMLSVDINPDGSVPPDGIVVSHSSGFPVLDQAAVKIVRLGAPYAAIPKDVLGENDMLTIIRTWKFDAGRGLSSR